MTHDAETIGRRMKRLREAKGWNRSELARACLVTPHQVSRWENGRALPQIAKRPAIAQALGVETEVLFFAGQERTEVLDDNADTVVLGVAREKNAAPHHKLAAAKTLKSKPLKGSADAELAHFRTLMEKADADLKVILAELDGAQA